MNTDDDQLKMLAIFHYVVAALAALFAMIPVIHLTVGLVMINAPAVFEGPRGNPQPVPPFVGWIIVAVAATLIGSGLIFASFILVTARFLSRRKHHLFCLVMGGVECMFMPFGTVLGVLTIVVLMRPSVKQLFEPVRAQQVPSSGAALTS